MESRYIYEESFKIRSSEVTPDGQAKLQAICDYLQEAAGDHSLELNFDISQLQNQNLTWVLYRLHIELDEYPVWRDTITVKTWPSSGSSLKAYRDFQIFNESGHKIGRTLSYWIMLNTKSRRPVRIPDEIIGLAPKAAPHVMEAQRERLAKLSKVHESKKFGVRRSDLDINHHVNNIRYIEWALEPLPAEQCIYGIDIEFHAECLYGEEVISEYYPADGGNKHQIRRAGDNKILALAQTFS